MNAVFIIGLLIAAFVLTAVHLIGKPENRASLLGWACLIGFGALLVDRLP